MDTISNIMPILQLILTFGNVCILLYGFAKFLGKPHDSLEKRVVDLEKWRYDVDRRLEDGSKEFKDYNQTNEIIIRSVIALIEFEMEYCMSEHKPISKNLEQAKNDLHGYLAKR